MCDGLRCVCVVCERVDLRAQGGGADAAEGGRESGQMRKWGVARECADDGACGHLHITRIQQQTPIVRSRRPLPRASKKLEDAADQRTSPHAPGTTPLLHVTHSHTHRQRHVPHTLLPLCGCPARSLSLHIPMLACSSASSFSSAVIFTSFVPASGNWTGAEGISFPRSTDPIC